MSSSNGGARSPKDLGLKSDSFVTVTSSTITPRVILNLEGGQKCGKTDWCLRNLPDPIVIFNFDNGLEGVAEKFTKKKMIIVAGIPMKGVKYPSYHFMRPIKQAGEKGNKDQKYLERVRAGASIVWERFITDYVEALQSSSVRSLVIDTGGACFQLAKFAFIGMDKVMQKDDPYGQKGGEMKSIFQGLVTDGYCYDKNVVWIHRVKDKWIGGEPAPGQYEADGYKQIPFEVQMTLRLKRKDTKTKGRTISSWLGEIRDCRLGDGARNNGMRFGDEGEPPLDFGTVMEMVSGTDSDEWL